MGKARRRVPRRHGATRRPSVSHPDSVWSSTRGPERMAGGPDPDLGVPDGLIGAAATSLLATMGEARSPLEAELVLCAAFGADSVTTA